MPYFEPSRPLSGEDPRQLLQLSDIGVARDLDTKLAYNRDRGPVSVFGARLCAQFRRCVSPSIGGAAG